MLSTSRSRRRHSSAIGQSQAVSPTLPVSSQAQTARAAPPQHPHGRHQRRRSIVVQRDLYANGERDAVRCRHGGLEGLDEILAMAPPVASGTFSAPSKSYSPLILSSRRGSAPAPSSSSSLPSTRSPAPSTSPLPSPGSPTSPPPATAPLVRARTLSGAVKRKPAPKVALEDDFDTVSDPRWDGRVVLPASSSGEPVAESLVRGVGKMSVENASASCGLGIRVGGGGSGGGSLLAARRRLSGPTALQLVSLSTAPVLPASPASPYSPTSPVSSASIASSALSRSTTATSVSSASASPPHRPFALMRKQASRPSSIFISQTSAGRRDEQALLDAWMDLIVGGGAPEPETAPSVEDGAGRSSERPSARPLPAVALPSHAATCAGLNVRGAPAPLEPEALASLATSLPPLLYSTPSSALADLSFHQPAASQSAPSPSHTQHPRTPLPALASTNGPATSLISPSPASPLPAITRAIRRASIASLSCSDAASSEYHSALEPQGGCFDAEEDVDGRARAESAEPPSSLSSKPSGAPARSRAVPGAFPEQPDAKRCVVSRTEKPLPPRPPRPPKSSRRSLEAVRSLAASDGCHVLVGRVASLSSNSGSSVDGVKHDVAVAAVPVVVLL